ncbi:hypothetical protein FB561_1617 [Kribbella amoyensis]|uniref:Uncharacterized protein n=1 Tax=Kribbella amoyensis TaxID=996641 RepID=A0A561BNT2_9ACTN|nr:hypothetical protein [Kribbella amoyensis]TWD80536.1 hypothetical protein FB561_1617 [Kribbella amoyensis]
MSTTYDAVAAALHDHNSGRGGVADPPRTLTELLAVHADAAIAVSGAGRTAWNGQVVEAGDGILGLANWDGTLHLDRECILEPLRELYARTGDQQSPEALLRYREALLTVLHEQSHFLGPAGATQEAARLAFRQPGSRALEEGVAEVWAHRRLDAYLTELGIDQVAPGIERVTAEPSYQAFVPAVELLTADLDQRAGLPPGSTLDQLNRETAEGQWPMVSDLVYRSSQLPSVVPAPQEHEVRLNLEHTLRAGFAALADSEPLPRADAATRSRSIAHRVLFRLDAEITSTYDRFAPPSEHRHRITTPPSEHCDRPTTPFTQAFAGLAPPGSRKPTAGPTAAAPCASPAARSPRGTGRGG